MDNGSRSAFSFVLNRFESRIQSLPRNVGKLFKNFVLNRQFQGSLLLLSSLLFGLLAHQYSKDLILREWEIAHAPSDLIWQFALEPKGYFKLKDPKKIHKVLRSLPLLTDSSATVWCTQNKTNIAVFHQNHGEAEPALFTFRSLSSATKNPNLENWELVGKGWNGFEKILSQETPLTPQPTPIKIKLDPREIRY